MFIGFTGHAFDSETEFAIKKGEVHDFNGYNFELASIFPQERPNHFAWIADLVVRDSERRTITTYLQKKEFIFTVIPIQINDNHIANLIYMEPSKKTFILSFLVMMLRMV